MSEEILNLQQVTKRFSDRHRTLTVLSGISATLHQGSSVALLGPSGSGKTTLLGLCAGLDLPSEGELSLYGKPVQGLSEEERATLRRTSMGFVFQNYQLIPTLTALENVCIPLELTGTPHPAKQAAQWLDRVGLADRMSHYPVQLSGGEQQRVAIARACVHQPAILFADEPTGNLDGETGRQIEHLLFDLHRDTGNTLLLITHDAELAQRASTRWHLRSGQLTLQD